MRSRVLRFALRPRNGLHVSLAPFNLVSSYHRAKDGAPVGFWLVPLTLVRLTMMDWVKLARVKGVKAAVSAVLACM